MKKLLVPPSLLVLTLVSCKSSSMPSANNAPVQAIQQQNQTVTTSPQPAPPKPKYGWKKFSDQTFETSLLGGLTIIPLPSTVSRLKVFLTSDSGVYGGLLPQNAAQPQHIVAGHQFRSLPCSLFKVERAEIECSSGPTMAFVVRDAHMVRRGLIGGGGLLAGIHGLVRPAERAAEKSSEPNKVHVELSTWSCLENCKSK